MMVVKNVFTLAMALPMFFAVPAMAQEIKELAPSTAQEIGAEKARADANYARGEEIARALGYFDALPREPEKQGPKGDFTRFTLENLMPNVYGRGGLSLRERELIVISIIIAQGNPSGLMWHFSEVTPRLKISERNLRELLNISCFYAGWPKCSYATSALGQVVMGPNKWPKELLMEPPKDDASAKPKSKP